MDKLSSEVLIHIGFHKTGTTWLQNLFFHKHPQFFYPYYGKNYITTKLFVEPDSFEFSPEVTKQALENDITKANSTGRILVISNERLCGRPNTGGRDKKELADRIKSVFPEAKVLIFIRNQFDMIVSTYGQYVKAGGPCSIERYLNGFQKFPSFTFSHFKYCRLIKYYYELFGKENVAIYLYEDFKCNKQNVLNNLCDFMGIDKMDVSEIGNIVVNPSLSKTSLFFMRNLNKIFVRYGLNPCPLLPIRGAKRVEKYLFKRIDKLLPGFLKNQSLLNDKWRQFISEYYKESNRELEKMLGISLKEKGYFV